MRKSIVVFLCSVCLLSLAGCNDSNKQTPETLEEVAEVSEETKESSTVPEEETETPSKEEEPSDTTETKADPSEEVGPSEEAELAEQLDVVATLFEGMMNGDRSAVESCFYEKDSNFETNVSSNLAIGDSIRDNTEIVYEAISGYDEAPLDEDREALYKKAFSTSETVRFTANIPMYQVIDVEGVPCRCEVLDIYEVEMFCVDGNWYIGLLNETEAKLIDYAPIAE